MTEGNTSHPFERHAQTVLVSLVVLLLAWTANTVNSNQMAIVQLLVKVESLEEAVHEPDGKFDEIENRLDAIEKAIGELSNDRYRGGRNE